MSPRKPVKPLETLAEEKILDEMHSTAMDVMNHAVERCMKGEDWDIQAENKIFVDRVVDTLSVLPDRLLINISTRAIELMDYFILENANNAEEIGEDKYFQICQSLMFMALLRPLDKINISKLRSLYSVSSLITGLHEVPNLQSLEVPVIRDTFVMERLTANISHLTNLREFKFREACNDEIIKALSENCPNLTTLKVPQSPFVTDRSVQFLLKLQNLMKLDVTLTSISLDMYRTLLSRLPTLKNVCWRSRFSTSVIAELDAEMLAVKEKFLGTIDYPNILVSSCPNLKRLKLFNQGDVDLTPLSRLRSVRKLKISRIDFPSCHISNIFPNIGKTLTKLTAISVEDLDMWVIVENCVCLKKIIIKHTILTNERGVINPNLPHFNSLTHLKMMFNVVDEHYLNAIPKYKSLEYFEMLGWVEVNDQYFAEAIANGDFRCLESLFVDGTDLSIATAELLLNSCPQLVELGYVKQWGQVQDHHIEMFLNRILDGNYDLRLA